MHIYCDQTCTCGWEVVAMLDEDEMSYEWHSLVVWRERSTGRLFWAEGSGCSCDSPSDIEQDELAPIDGDKTEFARAVHDFPCSPVEKPPLYRLAHRFGGYVYVTSTRATLM